ncbi:hypothetical protein RQP50_04740 [Paenibacillus sp. chi10]|uniref:Uncharacterized protein n=1 Tax=Paenibacillus suaedae TaxID=3077233 RepID=A0AAJ2JWM9_9BACL|nr:hypothetical protein [Paenibacillus sp. chi10]
MSTFVSDVYLLHFEVSCAQTLAQESDVGARIFDEGVVWARD